MTAASLAASYEQCRRLNRAHGTTYYASTFLLPATTRPHVHALYGFARYADEIVDDLGPAPVERREAALGTFGERFLTDLAAGRSEHPVLEAVVDTAVRFDLPVGAFERFLASMAMDLTVATYETFDDLLVYMDGSAAVIGELMLPLLDPVRAPAALEPARALGIAFQLTNFLRDVDEDLERDRVYVPQDDLHRFGADPSRRVPDAAWVDLMRFEIARTRAWYELADEGLDLLPARSAGCIRAARRLYGGILGRIEAAGYDVFTSRVRVPTRQKLAVAARGVLQR
ncbi:MAG: phytoene/squalene synthase family protein [Acidimicrobiia bacterium]|nr:phytoene/squalene synthase family protein [Acidimicrobiia bacterium]